MTGGVTTETSRTESQSQRVRDLEFFDLKKGFTTQDLQRALNERMSNGFLHFTDDQEFDGETCIKNIKDALDVYNRLCDPGFRIDSDSFRQEMLHGLMAATRILAHTVSYKEIKGLDFKGAILQILSVEKEELEERIEMLRCHQLIGEAFDNCLQFEDDTYNIINYLFLRFTLSAQESLEQAEESLRHLNNFIKRVEKSKGKMVSYSFDSENMPGKRTIN